MHQKILPPSGLCTLGRRKRLPSRGCANRVANPVRAIHLINAMQSDEQRRLAAQGGVERLLQRQEYVAAEALLQEVALTSEDWALLRQGRGL
jgi:hypothetical protein